MALIVKSSIDILPWTEIEKQKIIEEKEEFLDKKAHEEIQANVQTNVQEENNKNSIKKEKTSLKKQSKKEVNE